MQEVKDRMANAKVDEEALRFTPVLKGSDALRLRAPKSAVSVYQLTLAGVDLLLSLFAFWGAAKITGLVWLIEGHPGQYVCLFAVAFVLISFFPTYHLYSYRYIFIPKAHLVYLFKAICWSVLTLGMIFVIFTYPQLFRGMEALFTVSALGVVLLVLSRFYWRYLINLLKGMGIGFLLVGIMAFLSRRNNPRSCRT